MKSMRSLAALLRNGLQSQAVALVLLLLAPAGASGRPSPGATLPMLLSPAADVTLGESELSFAWKAAPGTSEHFLLVSESAFDPTGWTGLPTGTEVRVVRSTSPRITWASVGWRLEGDARIWWAVADRDPATGRLSISEVRTAYVQRRFANQAVQSPLIAVSPIGRATPEPAGPRSIHLAAGFDIDPAVGEPALATRSGIAESPVGGRRTFVVFYGAADPDEARRAIAAAGGRVVSYLPDHAFLVRTSGGAEIALDIAGSWVGAYRPAYKRSARLSADPAFRQAVNVLLFPDGDLPAALDLARAGGATVLTSSDNGINKVLRLEVTPAGIDALAASGDVAWIEPYLVPQADNANAQGIVQTGVVGNRRVWDLGIKGEGQIVMTTDSGINTSHIAIKDPLVPITTFGAYPTHRKLIEYDRSTSDPRIVFGDHDVFHGSHTAGTVGGNNDAYGTNTNDGMAKGAKLWFVDMSGPALGTGLITPGDLNDLYQPGYIGNAGGAPRIASNSWGNNVAGAYTIDAFTVDQFLWNHTDFMLFFANGNAGPGTQTVGSPATAKDCVSVGASGNGASLNSLASFSSRGPTADGRFKPTICAPGVSVVSSTSGDSTYAPLSGTSMACPAAAGCAALIRQYLVEGWYPTGVKVPANGFTPSGALLKAMVVNSGNNTFTGFQSPNSQTGWGRVDADSAVYFSGDTRRLLVVDQTTGLGSGQSIDYTINVTDGTIPLKVTLVWNDYPGNPAVVTQLVNNLDLTVSNGPTTYQGNVYTGGVSVTGGSADTRNVEECVRIAAPATGIWTIHINGTNIPIGPQPFALVITGGIGTTAGALALDRASYGSSATVQLRVTDTNASSPLSLTVTSSSEPAGETATLTGSDGVFTGSVPLSPVAGSVGDGTLRVSNGDLLTATYNDVSPVASVVAQAQVSFEAPTITNVLAHGAGANAATITWTTNTNADSRVYYGTTPALGSSTALDLLATFTHSQALTGLGSDQLYYFDVESRDLNGNLTRDDNGGAHYRFTTGAPGDILIVYDGASFKFGDRYTAALAATGWSYDLWQGSLSETPKLGDIASGLRSYRAVWWQNDIDNYPPFADAAIDSITAYLDGGGRLAVTGHDIAWANGDPTSPFYTSTRSAWLTSTLHTLWLADPAGWTGIQGVAADPISGAYTGGVAYAESRAGASGDEVNGVAGGGTVSYDWFRTGGNHCAFRWESGGPLGTPGSSVWAGQTSRLATEYFEWSRIDPGLATSTIRNDVLNKTLNWLVGHDKPTVTVAAPNGGEVLTGNSVDIAWTETIPSGVSARKIEYSPDAGASWFTVTASAGPSPYSWDLTAVPNTPQAMVRIRLTDGGTPSISGIDVSDAVFTINRTGGDLTGPTVVAGSIHSSPNPIDNTQAATLTATVSDALSGGAAVTAAEWSFGDTPAPAGTGQAMSGAFGTTTVAVSAALATNSFPTGVRRLWVRGRDAAGNWGPPGSLQIQVNGNSLVSVGDLPRDYGLDPALPNPATARTSIAWALPRDGRVDLSIYDVSGRMVRALVRGQQGAGLHASTWDLRDDRGRADRAGVYYVRLDVAGRTFARRLVALD